MCIEIKDVRTVVKAALPALDGLTDRFLANMAPVTLDGSARHTFGTGVLQREVPEYLQDGVRYIAVVILVAHITTPSRQMIAVAGFGDLGLPVVTIHSVHGRVRAESVEAVPIFIDRSIVLGSGLARQRGGEKLQWATDNKWTRP